MWGIDGYCVQLPVEQSNIAAAVICLGQQKGDVYQIICAGVCLNLDIKKNYFRRCGRCSLGYEEMVDRVLDDVVTLASSAAQPRPVEDGNPPTTISD